MGIANMKSGRPKKQPRVTAPGDLLRGVHGTEIDWEHVQPVLNRAIPGQMPFVYFIAEPDDGYIKIGTAMNPVKRLRDLQTGNARRLRIERVIYGDQQIERLLHAYFRPWMAEGRQIATTIYKTARARETEWFKPASREALLQAADVIWRHEQQIERVDGNGITGEQLQAAIGAAMIELGHTLRREDEIRLLAQGPGYITVGLGL